MDTRPGRSFQTPFHSVVEHGRPKRNNVIMSKEGKPYWTAGEYEVLTEEEFSRYLDAMKEADTVDTPDLANALAELLAARLDGRDAPDARTVLESFADSGNDTPREGPT